MQANQQENPAMIQPNMMQSGTTMQQPVIMK